MLLPSSTSPRAALGCWRAVACGPAQPCHAEPLPVRRALPAPTVRARARPERAPSLPPSGAMRRGSGGASPLLSLSACRVLRALECWRAVACGPAQPCHPEPVPVPRALPAPTVRARARPVRRVAARRLLSLSTLRSGGVRGCWQAVACGPAGHCPSFSLLSGSACHARACWWAAALQPSRALMNLCSCCAPCPRPPCGRVPNPSAPHPSPHPARRRRRRRGGSLLSPSPALRAVRAWVLADGGLPPCTTLPC